MEHYEQLPNKSYPENIDQQLKSLTAYYGNLKHRDEYWSDLLFAAEEVLKQHDESSTVTYDALLAGGFVPGKAAFSADHQIAMEQFTLLPLNIIAPQVDMFYDIESAQKWYEYVTSYVLRSTADSHSNKCLDTSIKTFPSMCRQSLVCPVRTLQATLVGDIAQPDFESIGFLMDPQRQMDFADMKINVAIDNHLEYPQYAFALSAQCHREFDSKFGKGQTE